MSVLSAGLLNHAVDLDAHLTEHRNCTYVADAQVPGSCASTPGARPDRAGCQLPSARTRRGACRALAHRPWTVPGFMDTGLGGEFVNAPIA